MSVEGIYLSSRPLWQVTKKYGLRLRELLPHLQYVLVAGQHVTASFRKGMESLWAAPLYDAYPMTDVCLPSANCPLQSGTFHFPNDAFLVEVIDSETGGDLTGTGKIGEIVVSSLLLEGTPLLRFRSDDLGFTLSEPCACGRTGMRIGIVERNANAVLVGDRAVFSSEVEEVLYGIPELFMKQFYLTRKKIQPQAELIVHVEGPGDPSLEAKLRALLTERLKQVLQVPSDIAFVSEGDERYVALYKFLKVVPES
jgi:phenylacetate-CoA ligase